MLKLLSVNPRSNARHKMEDGIDYFSHINRIISPSWKVVQNLMQGS